MHHLKNSNTLESHKISQNLTKSHKAEIGMNTTESELIDVLIELHKWAVCLMEGVCAKLVCDSSAYLATQRKLQ